MALSSVTMLRDLPSQKLDKRVQIRRRTDEPIGLNELESFFSETVYRWARIQPVGSAIYAEGQQTGHYITHRVYMRHVDGISSAHEIVHNDNVYRVLRSSDVDGGKRYTVLEVEQLK